MTHDEAFLQEIIAHPGDDAPRLIYADWLDEQGQTERAEFLRVECRSAARPPAARKWAALRKRAEPLGAVWVARVSRPPIGVCVRSRLFVPADRPTTEKAIQAVERRFAVRFPADYRAFLLNYNGGGFAPRLANPDKKPDRNHIEEWFWGVGLGKKSWLPDLGTLAESYIKETDGWYREAKLFPIGAPENGVPENEGMVYLIETGNEWGGRVILHDLAMDPDPWVNPWPVLAPSFAGFLADLS